MSIEAISATVGEHIEPEPPTLCGYLDEKAVARNGGMAPPAKDDTRSDGPVVSGTERCDLNELVRQILLGTRAAYGDWFCY